VTFVANLKKKKTPPPSHFEGWRPFWELHIFRFQSVVFCVEFSGNQIFRKSPQNFSSSGVALRRKVCTPPPLPPVYNLKFLRLKLTESQVSANERLRATRFHLTSSNSQRPIQVRWPSFSNPLRPNSSHSLARNSSSLHVLVNNFYDVLSLSSFCSTDLVSSLVNGQHRL
jgi:hypothetical protein